MKGLSVIKREMLPPLYLITDRFQTNGRPLLEVLQQALEGGAKMIQLREKDLSGKAHFALAREARDLTSRYGARLLINDRIDIALAVDADGVHLPAHSFSPREARLLLGKDKLVGVSTHSIEEAERAEREGADFITFSPVFFTPSKVGYGEPQGLGKFNNVCSTVTIPVYALGGIKETNLEEVMNSGAERVAMISAVFSAQDVKNATSKIYESLHHPMNKEIK